MSLAGHTLADRYDILERIGGGGMGDVYRARDRELDELVALKVIRAELADNPTLIERFRHEVKLARRVTHANVARTFELGNAGGVMYCTMELVEGESLTRRLQAHKVLPVAEAAAIARAVCDALAAAHAAGVIHRDIKPDNVLIASDGRVVVADFGVAAVEVERAGELSGTAAYMAPEQAAGAPPTPAADVYSAGCVLYEMLTGQRAFEGPVQSILDLKSTVSSLVIPTGAGYESVPEELREVVARATERDPARRFSTADALRRALAPWAKHAPALAPVATLPPRAGEQRVVVVAPRTTSDPRIFVAYAIHEAMLGNLSRMPHVRVQSRPDAQGEKPGTYVVSLVLDAALALEIRRAGDAQPLLVMELPLATDRVSLAAVAGAAAVGSALGLAGKPARDPAGAAYEPWLRARHVTQLGLDKIVGAVEELEEAARIAPNDARIIATLAMGYVRRAFFIANTDAHNLVKANELARRALQLGPEVAESHLAMGHLELNIGDCVVAARHFRMAISRAPFLPEGHEYLGRLLLEAGYLEQGLERLDDASAIAPHVVSPRWEIARAWALEGRWEEYDRILPDMRSAAERVLSVARYLRWRGDEEKLATLFARTVEAGTKLGMLATLLHVYAKGTWEEHKPAMVSAALDIAPPNRRRRAFVAQLVAEVAAWAGDIDTSAAVVQHAIHQGLFDLHWLDKCPLLDGLRADARFEKLRAPVRLRAEAILDALYGDHSVQTFGTQVAPA